MRISIHPVRWFRRQNEVVQAVVAALTVIAFGLFVFFVSVWHIQRIAKNSLVPYERSREMISIYMDTLARPDSLDAKFFNVFKAQQKLLDMRASHYKQLSIVFFRNYYANLVVTIIFSCLGGLLLFVLVSKGWAGSSVPLKSVFLTISIVLTFSGLFPKVFNQEENFKENIKYYMNYQQEQMKIVGQLSYFNSKDSVNWTHIADSMVAVNTAEINQLTNYILNINAKELKSVNDIYRAIQSSTSLGRDSVLLSP